MVSFREQSARRKRQYRNPSTMRLLGPRRHVLVSLVLVLLTAGIGMNQMRQTHALTATSSPSPSAAATAMKPIRRVAIIGSGIAGLSTAHALVSPPSSSTTANEKMEVRIFDARTGLDRGIGAGIQLNGALAVLGKINPQLQRSVLDAGRPIELIRSRSKSWSLEDRPYETLLELPLRQVISKAGGETKDALLPGDGQTLLWTSIMRGALQETMYECLPSSTKTNVQFDKMLVDIRPATTAEQQDGREGGGGAMCVFRDGTVSGPFDLIIGADGIKSAVKEYVDNKQGKISADPSKRQGAAAGIYTGLRIRYAVRDGTSGSSSSSSDPSNDDDPPCITQYFGDAAYCFSAAFGAGKDKPNTKVAFVTFLDEDYFGPFKRPQKEKTTPTTATEEDVDENADWTQDTEKSVDLARAAMLQKIQDCNVPDLELKETIENADRFFELGVYAHNPFCAWSKEIVDPADGTSTGAYVALCGDAAHALPPFLGQGANQAIQDAYSLAMRVHQYNEQLVTRSGTEDLLPLKAYLDDYEKARWPAAFNIFWKASFLGYLETGGFNGAYAKFRDLFFKFMGAIGVASYVLLSAATPKV